jgi:hypothetical protein
MAEESVSGMYAEISADMEKFDQSIDRVYDRLDKLEEKDVSVQAETKAVESSIDSLATEMMALGGALTTVYSYLAQTSGGLGAMTSMAAGLIGAGVDTFLVEVMIPLWGDLQAALGDTEGELQKNNTMMKLLADQMVLTDDGVVMLKDDTIQLDLITSSLLKRLNDEKAVVDDYGNSVLTVGDQLFYFDDQTGNFLGTTDKLALMLSEDLNPEMVITKDLIGDVSEEWGLMAADVVLYAQGGADALETLWAADPSTHPGSQYLADVATAAEEVRIRLGAMLLELGINPATGESMTDTDMWRLNQAAKDYYDTTGSLSADQVASFLLSGGS